MTSARKLVVDAAKAAVANDLAGEAAKMAFYFSLAVFPLVVTVFTVTGILGGDDAFSTLMQAAQRLMPPDAWPVVRQLVAEITERDRPGLLSFSVLLTTWAASNGIAALTEGLNKIYKISEPRSWWRRRLIAFAVLLIGVILILVGTIIVVPAGSLLELMGVGQVWSVARWPIGFALVTAAIWLAFQYLPARDQRAAKRETLAGAVVATLLWMAAALGFRVYLEQFASYGATYGTLGSVIVLLLWFWLDALVVLVGAQLAAAIERGRVSPAEMRARADA